MERKRKGRNSENNNTIFPFPRLLPKNCLNQRVNAVCSPEIDPSTQLFSSPIESNPTPALLTLQQVSKAQPDNLGILISFQDPQAIKVS